MNKEMTIQDFQDMINFATEALTQKTKTPITVQVVMTHRNVEVFNIREIGFDIKTAKIYIEV